MTSSQTSQKSFAIIGAGPMGLMCAMELARRGHAVEIFERDDRIGGMSATFDFDGIEIERYYHFICKPDQALFELVRDLGLDHAMRWVDTRMGFYCDGRLYDWGTPQALLSFDRIGWMTKLRYGLMAMRAKSIRDWRPYDRFSAVDWLKRWLGQRGYDVLWRSLFELKFYDRSEQLSAAWLGTRIKRIALSRRNIFQETMGYLEGGSTTLLNAMEREVVKHNGLVHLSSRVEEIVPDADGSVFGLRIGGVQRAFDKVISTVPIQYVPRLAPTLPADFRDKIEAIENIAVVCVILKLDRSLTPNFWLNINDAAIGLPGLIEYSNLNPGDGSHILYAPFYMPKSHPKFARGNDVFITETLDCLARINPDFQMSWVSANHCHRYEFAQTVCPPGFYDRLPAMRTPMRGLYMADTSYYYPEDRSISESVRVGRQLVDCALTDPS